MGRNARILSAVAVRNLSKPGLHFVGGVPNLALHVSSSGCRSWILRYRLNGKSREMGLGRFPEISLMEARDTALDKRAMLRGGVDPIMGKAFAVREHCKGQMSDFPGDLIPDRFGVSFVGWLVRDSCGF